MKIASEMPAPQQRALLNIADGRISSHGLSGRSEMGGHTRTMMALYRGGMVLANGSLTDKGRDVVHALRMKTPNVELTGSGQVHRPESSEQSERG